MQGLGLGVIHEVRVRCATKHPNVLRGAAPANGQRGQHLVQVFLALRKREDRGRRAALCRLMSEAMTASRNTSVRRARWQRTTQPRLTSARLAIGMCSWTTSRSVGRPPGSRARGRIAIWAAAALLGSLLAFLRRDRVVGVDANPDWGSLGRRLAPGHPVFIDDLLAGPLETSQPRPMQVDAALARGPDGLMIAPAPTDPDRASQLDEEAYRRLFARLGDLVGTLILDCGTGLDSPAARAALACADQLVLVTDGEPDTASLVAEAAARQLSAQARPVVLLVNKFDRSSRVDVAALERQIDFADGLVLVPNHRAGADEHRGLPGMRRAASPDHQPRQRLGFPSPRT
jgi:MinD-like ATPase involved in chromosome partitioning or flagellar assembly